MNWVSWMVLAFSASAAAAAEAKLQVVTSFPPAYSLTVNITKDLADVQNLLPGDVGLHDYQLSPKDLRLLGGARLIVINGLGMESFLDRALKNLGPDAPSKIVQLSRGLAPSQLIREEHPHDHAHAGDHAHDHHHGDVNPHIWLDPLLAAHAVTNIAAALQQADPANAAAYARNAAEYVQRLHQLDKALATRLAPVRQAAFITYHNAFPYFVRRYQLNLAGVVERVPEVSPSPREMSALLRTIREKKVKALFTEPQAPSRVARRIAQDAGVKLEHLDPLETGPLTPASYEEGLRRNAEQLVKALQ